MKRLRLAVAAAVVAGAVAAVPASAGAVTTPPGVPTLAPLDILIAIPSGPAPLITVNLGL